MGRLRSPYDPSLVIIVIPCIYHYIYIMPYTAIYIAIYCHIYYYTTYIIINIYYIKIPYIQCFLAGNPLIYTVV